MSADLSYLDAGWQPGAVDPMASRTVVEWDWVVTKSYSRLHAPLIWEDPDYHAWVEDGRTVCGLTGELHIPGIFSRTGLPRCFFCCLAVGMPQGVGSPKNDDACRPLVEQRIAAWAPPPGGEG